MAFGAKIKLTVDDSGGSAFRAAIQKHVDDVTAKNPILIKNVGVQINEKEFTTQINKVQETVKNGIAKGKPVVVDVDAKLSDKTVQKTTAAINSLFGEESINRFTSAIKMAKNAAISISEKFNETAESVAKISAAAASIKVDVKPDSAVAANAAKTEEIIKKQVQILHNENIANNNSINNIQKIIEGYNNTQQAQNTLTDSTKGYNDELAKTVEYLQQIRNMLAGMLSSGGGKTLFQPLTQGTSGTSSLKRTLTESKVAADEATKGIEGLSGATDALRNRLASLSQSVMTSGMEDYRKLIEDITYALIEHSRSLENEPFIIDPESINKAISLLVQFRDEFHKLDLNTNQPNAEDMMGAAGRIAEENLVKVRALQASEEALQQYEKVLSDEYTQLLRIQSNIIDEARRLKSDYKKMSGNERKDSFVDNDTLQHIDALKTKYAELILKIDDYNKHKADKKYSASYIQQLNDEIAALEKEIEAVTREQQARIDGANKAQKALDKTYNNIKRRYAELESVTNANPMARDTETMDSLRSKLESFEVMYSSFDKKRDEFSEGTIENIRLEGEALQSQIEAERAALKTRVDNIKEAQSELNKIARKEDNAFGKLETLKDSGRLNDEELERLEELSRRHQEYEMQMQDFDKFQDQYSAERIAELTQEGEALQNLANSFMIAHKNRMTAEREEEVANKRRLATEQEIATVRKKLETFAVANPKAYASYGQEIDAMLSRLSSSAEMTDEDLARINIRLTQISTASKVAGQNGDTFFKTLQKGWEKFGGWSIVTRTMMGAYRVFKDMIQAVRDLDAAMTELKKVTDLSEQSYRNYVQTASEMAQIVGATLADAVNATADFARLGYDLADSQALAKAALVYKNVGDGIDTIGEASESIISTIKAFERFGVTAQNSMDIIDKFNEVGNNFAISSEGIGTALQKSASSLAAANNTLEESIALTAGMNSVLQNPEVVGTALKTVSLYLRAAKVEAEEAGESTEGMANSVSKLREQILKLTSNRVDIMVDATTFKSTYQILKEISEIWEDLADVDQAAILEKIGGKRNATAVTSLLTNFQDAEAALQTALNASGSALRENEKYLDSINGRISILQAKFETLANTLINSNIIKAVVDLGSKVLDFLSALEQIHALLPLITAAFVSFTQVKTLGNVSNVIRDINAELSMIAKGAQPTRELMQALNGLTNSGRNAVTALIKNAAAAHTLTDEQAAATLSALGLQGGIKAVDASEKALTITNKGLGVSFKALAASIPVWGWIALAISAVITAVSALTDHMNKSRQATIDAANAIKDNYSSAASAYDSNTRSLNSMKAEFDELSKHVKANGSNIDLTSAEYERFLSLVDSIINVSPSIVQAYDSQGKAVLNYKTALDDAISAQDELMSNAEDIYLSGGDKLFKGYAETYKDNVTKIREAIYGNGLSTDNINDTIFGMDSVFGIAKKGDAWQEAVKKLTGFDVSDLATKWSNASDEQILKLYEDYKNLIVLLRQSGEFEERELQTIQARLQGVAEYYANIKKAREDLSEYTYRYLSHEYNKREIPEGFESFGEIPAEALSIYKQALADICDVQLDYLDNVELARQFTEKFASSISGNVIPKFQELAQTMSSGDYSELLNSLDAFIDNPVSQKRVSEYLGIDIDDTNVLHTLITYLRTFRTEVAESNKGAIPYTATLKDFKTVINELESSYKVLASAQKEMAEDGGLSVDTIKSVIDAMGEGESVLKYLRVENGQIKLNTEAWAERAAEMVSTEKLELQAEIDSLRAQRAEVRENTKEWQELSLQISQDQQKMEAYDAIYAKITASEEAAAEAAKKFADVAEKLNITSELDNAGKAISGLQDAMEQLTSGTALTEAQLVQLATAYPKLLEASDWFTDGSIKGQMAMLKNLLQSYDDEYDATVALEIAKLEVINQALQDRITAETEKAKILSEIQAQEVSDSADYRAWLVEQISKYNDIEGENYVTFKRGELQVEEETLSKMLEQVGTTADGMSEIWSNQSLVIADAYEEGAEGALTVLNKTGEKTEEWINGQKTMFKSLGNVVQSSLSGDINALYDEAGKVTTRRVNTYVDSGIKAEQKSIKDIIKENQKALAEASAGESATGEKGVQDWVDTQKEITRQRIEALQAQYQENLKAINNLRKLQDVDLTSVYFADKKETKSGSDDKEKEIEKYIADVDAYYDALKRLAKAQEQRADIERQLSNESDLQSKIELERQLINAYKEEIDAEANLVSERKNTIEANVEALRELGFAVEYVAESNDLYISNWSHVNDLIADSKGDYETVEEATNELVKSTEELLNTTDELNESNKEATSSMIDLGYAIDTSNQNILEYIDAMATNAKQALSDVAGAYKTLLDAVNGYNESGNISVDTFQSLLDLSPAYLTYLQNESGEMKLNKEALEELIKKKVENLALSKAMALVDTIHEYRDDAGALRELASATGEATKATWDFVYANLAAENLDSALYEAFKSQIDALRSLVGEVNVSYEDAGKSIDEVIAEINKKADEAKQALSEVAGAYRTLIDAVDSYNESGYLSLDTFQQIMDLSPAYIAYLYDESGAINLNRGALEELIAAKVENLALSKAMALVDSIHQYAGDAEALYALATATTVATGATWDLVYARLAAENLDAELNDAFVAQIDAIRNLAATAQAGIGQSFAAVVKETKSSTEATNSFNKAQQEANEDAKKAMKEQLEQQKEILKNEADKKIDALKDQISKFREIVELKKKSLEASKDEREYEEDIADRIKAIADLQSRIDQLSLDDSRQAQAERQSLMEELMQKQKDLADVQGEHAYDSQMDALDELADNYEKEKNAEIERIEKNLAREQKIYDDALDRLENGAGSVYGQIEAMNINAGNSIYNNLTVGWNQATRAVQDYGASVAAVTGAQITIPNNAMSPLYSRVDAAELYHQLGGTNSAALLPAFNAAAGTASGLTSRKLQEVYNGIGGVSNSSNSSFVYEPTISVSINSNGALSGSSANDFGTQVANVAIQQLNDALARKGIGSSTIATLKAL